MTALPLAGALMLCLAGVARGEDQSALPTHQRNDMGAPFGVLGEIMVGAFNSTHRPVHGPVVQLELGYAWSYQLRDALSASLGAGWGWGERQEGGLFPGLALKRIMAWWRVSNASPHSQALAVTYGGFADGLGTLSADVGLEVEASRPRSAGPMARVGVGWWAVGLDLTVWLHFASHTDVGAQLGLWFDVGEAFHFYR